MVFGKKKAQPAPPQVVEPPTEVIEVGQPLPPVPQPPQLTEEQQRLQELLDDVNDRYAAFAPEHFPQTGAATQANLLLAIYGELRELNENHRTLISLIESMKE